MSLSQTRNRWSAVATIGLTLSVSTACLRLTPSERLAGDGGTISTDSDTASLSEDTDTHPCQEQRCREQRPDAGTSSCADGTLTIAAGDGYCFVDTDNAAKCHFDTEQVICPGDGCADAAHCKDAPCHGMRCNTPPPNRCVGEVDGGSDGSKWKFLVVYEREGGCQINGPDGGTSCSYEVETTIACPNGCVQNTDKGAHCVDEPCRGVVCNQPPARYCVSKNELVVFLLDGRCTDDGRCVYDKRSIDCSSEGGCANGRCVGNSCKAMSCYQPPARYCYAADQAIDFHPVGTCDEKGACVYRQFARNCADSNCSKGICGSEACVDAAFCRTPPATHCGSDKELVTWDGIQECSLKTGRCSYTTESKTCAKGDCVDGRCTGDYCEGPSWPCGNGKPAEYCFNDKRAVEPLVSGNHGCCDYRDEVKDCSGGCHAGVCEQSRSAPPPSGTSR